MDFLIGLAAVAVVGCIDLVSYLWAHREGLALFGIISCGYISLGRLQGEVMALKREVAALTLDRERSD